MAACDIICNVWLRQRKEVLVNNCHDDVCNFLLYGGFAAYLPLKYRLRQKSFQWFWEWPAEQWTAIVHFRPTFYLPYFEYIIYVTQIWSIRHPHFASTFPRASCSFRDTIKRSMISSWWRHTKSSFIRSLRQYLSAAVESFSIHFPLPDIKRVRRIGSFIPLYENRMQILPDSKITVCKVIFWNNSDVKTSAICWCYTPLYLIWTTGNSKAALVLVKTCPSCSMQASERARHLPASGSSMQQH